MFIVQLDREIPALIARRNQPMLTALDACIEHLENYLLGVEPGKDTDAERALSFAKRAVELERQFQARATS